LKNTLKEYCAKGCYCLFLTGLGTILGMNTSQTVETPSVSRSEAPSDYYRVKPRKHVVRYSLLTGRARYPFKAMLLDDYFLLDSQDHAVAARNALKTFYRRYAGRKFTVKEDVHIGYWVCKRIA